MPAPVREGDVLAGKYRVDRVLGAGGMGVVVAATHLQLEQRVALKFLVSNGFDEQAGMRFLREARSIVKLRSEHVVRVLDTGTLDSGQPYIVMELLEGQDLQQELTARGPIPLVEAVDWVLQACEAIAEAHVAGIVHRDLKPANLFLTRRPDHSALIKVLDFGIAKLLDVQRAPDYSLTKTSALMGSPHYMSPEQIRNAKSVDRRADIWALGIVLYELLGGTAPFSAATAPALLAQIVADPPRPLRDSRPDVPRALEAVINRCLEKEPAKRYATIGELARELARFGSEEGRASSERVTRISATPAFPEPASSAPRAFANEPTLISIEPPARAAWPLSLRLGVPVAFVALVALLVFWFTSREREVTAQAAGAASAAVTALAPAPSMSVTEAQLVVAPSASTLPAAASSAAAPVVALAPADAATNGAVHQRPSLSAAGAFAAARPVTRPVQAKSFAFRPIPAPSEPAPENAANPLGDRK